MDNVNAAVDDFCTKVYARVFETEHEMELEAIALVNKLDELRLAVRGAQHTAYMRFARTGNP